MIRQIARWTIRRFDALLRRAQGIYEFTAEAGCILRLQRGRCRRAVRLADGTVLRPGEPILNLHLWNEHVPPMPAGGPDPAWGVRFVRRWHYSLGLLARYWQENADLAAVRALRGVFALPGGEDLGLQERTLRKMGFEVTRPPRTVWKGFTDFWENLYAWAIVWTYNPSSLRARRLLRLERRELWMARNRLVETPPAAATRAGRGGPQA